MFEAILIQNINSIDILSNQLAMNMTFGDQST